MTFRAHVTHDFARLGIGIWLVRDFGEGLPRAVGQPLELVFENVDPMTPHYTEPTLRLPEDMARALLDALAAHFGGTGEVQTLRKDYLAERQRVDKMIDHLTSRPEAAR